MSDESPYLAEEAYKADKLLKYCATADAIKRLPDAKLHALIIDHVWAQLPLGSPQNLILDELLTRFAKAKGIPDHEELQR